MILDNYLIEIQKEKDDMDDSNFDPKELKMGIEIEKEHTDDIQLAKKISKDHLKEFPKYYTRLKKMEKQAKKENKLKIKDQFNKNVNK